MKYLLLGAGFQGTAMARDLLKTASGNTGVTVVDREPTALERLQTRLNDPRRNWQSRLIASGQN